MSTQSIGIKKEKKHHRITQENALKKKKECLKSWKKNMSTKI